MMKVFFIPLRLLLNNLTHGGLVSTTPSRLTAQRLSQQQDANEPEHDQATWLPGGGGFPKGFHNYYSSGYYMQRGERRVQRESMHNGEENGHSGILPTKQLRGPWLCSASAASSPVLTAEIPHSCPRSNLPLLLEKSQRTPNSSFIPVEHGFYLETGYLENKLSASLAHFYKLPSLLWKLQVLAAWCEPPGPEPLDPLPRGPGHEH